MNKASKGFIYFSLGTNVKTNRLPERVFKVFLETFTELPYTVLWKIDQEDLPGKPDNVIISKWFPQQDILGKYPVCFPKSNLYKIILGHPNIKLFITQGGLQSLEEAIYNHVPIVGIPFAIDQQANILNMVDKGVGILLDYNVIEKESFKEAIFEVMNNPL